MCENCNGSGMNCISYKIGFYVIIIFCCITILGIFGFIGYKIRQIKNRKLESIINEDEYQSKTLITS
jgi:hypothetical protein